MIYTENTAARPADEDEDLELQCPPSEAALRVWHTLALAIADAIECPETPARLVNALGDWEEEIVDLLAPPGDSRDSLAAHIRGRANEFMRMRRESA